MNIQKKKEQHPDNTRVYMKHEIFWAKSIQEHCYSSVDEFHVLIIVMPPVMI